MNAAARHLPVFRVDAVHVTESLVRLRLPFRFGVITLTEAPQAFVTVRITTADGVSSTGVSASVLAPKWFDKRADLDNDTNIAHLRTAISLAREAYTSQRNGLSAFGHFAAHHRAILHTASQLGLNALTAGFGPAMLDAAIADALGRLTQQSFAQLTRANLLGIEPLAIAPDLAGFDMGAWLGQLTPSSSIAARHTVGMVDPLDDNAARTTDDGLPETLSEVVARYGHRYFKLKVGGELTSDIARLTDIARILDRIDESYIVSLDGNEQYENIDAVEALWRKMGETSALARLVDSIIFIEQPIRRDAAMTTPVHALASQRPLIIDESDDSFDAFPDAQALGYSGVSSKLCKGFYKSLINAARCRHAASNTSDGAESVRPVRPLFMSAEDLTNQAGVAVQQDLALISLIGVTHVERNGHHYVDGFGHTEPRLVAAFLADHPDLYAPEKAGADHRARLRIEAGQLNIGSLQTPGFGVGERAYRETMKFTRDHDGESTV